jgi:hypothetical protein
MWIQAKRDHQNSFLLKGSMHQQRKSAKIMLFSTLVSGDHSRRPLAAGRANPVKSQLGQTSK